MEHGKRPGPILTKEQLRAEFSALRDTLIKENPQLHAQASWKVCQQLISQEFGELEHTLKNGRTPAFISAYYPFRSELDLSALFHWIHRLETRYQPKHSLLALPFICGTRLDANNMRFVAVPAKILLGTSESLPSFLRYPARIADLNELTAPYHEVLAHDISHMIIPGLSFSSLGLRLGYGGGYYDRYLHEKEHQLQARFLGVCFSEQISEQLQELKEAHDKRLNAVYHAPCTHLT